MVVPSVEAVTSQGAPASAVVTDAVSLPGITTIFVTAQNGIDTNTYTIGFTAEITPVNQTFELTFEPGTAGSDPTRWNVFENGDVNPPLEVVPNPDPTGVNTTSRVAKLTTLAGASSWAGCETQHGTIWEWELVDGYTTTIRIDVYKTEISDVYIKIVNSGNGTVAFVNQPNTVINAWETLTYDISAAALSGDNNNVDQIVVLTDWQPEPRASGSLSYFDNVSWEGLKTKEALPVLGIADFETTKFKVYPNPTQTVWNINSSNQTVNSIQVFDVLGKQVLSLNPNSVDVRIDATLLPKGLYFALIETKAGRTSIKLVKN